jgi:hypothetical protein
MDAVTSPQVPTSAAAEKVWRYMSFARFVWLLQKRQLWLARADLLSDPWEIANRVVPDEKILGRTLAWEPERHLDCVRVHPEADFSFFETVTAVINQYAPALRDCVEWSAMKDGPPF